MPAGERHPERRPEIKREVSIGGDPSIIHLNGEPFVLQSDFHDLRAYVNAGREPDERGNPYHLESTAKLSERTGIVDLTYPPDNKDLARASYLAFSKIWPWAHFIDTMNAGSTKPRLYFTAKVDPPPLGAVLAGMTARNNRERAWSCVLTRHPDGTLMCNHLERFNDKDEHVRSRLEKLERGDTGIMPVARHGGLTLL